MSARAAESPWRKDALVDSAALALAVLISILPYIRGLGFYSDDWAFLGAYATAQRPTVAGYFTASYSAHHAMRPVQLWLCAALYRVFGLEPFGYHAFNALVVAACPLLCYWLLRELRVPRLLSFAVAFVYGLLPSYSTDRFWFVAFAITLSTSACLVSMLADVKAAASGGRSGFAWKAFGAAAALVSGLAYETALGLLLLTPVLMVVASWQAWGRPDRRRRRYLATLIAIHLAVLAAIAGFKLHTTVRLGVSDTGAPGQIVAIARAAVRRGVPEGAYGLNVFSAAHVHFGTYGALLPRTAAVAAGLAPRWLVLMAIGLGVVAFLYLMRTTRSAHWPSLRAWTAFMLGGLVVFALGYAIFLTNYNVQFTAAGIANRSAMSAALGSAICLVAAAGLVASAAPARVRVPVFSALVAALGGCGFLIVNVIARDWNAAYAAERTHLAEIQRHFPTLPPHTTLLLDSVCPYVGPAVVFEANWDLAGALEVLYHDATLKADVVTPRLDVTDGGIVTTIYDQRTTYPYGGSLLIYNARTGAIRTLTDAAAARPYFASRSAVSCPPAQPGVGVRLF